MKQAQHQGEPTTSVMLTAITLSWRQHITQYKLHYTYDITITLHNACTLHGAGHYPKI